jgi:hypothetical protein
MKPASSSQNLSLRLFQKPSARKRSGREFYAYFIGSLFHIIWLSQ